MIVAPSGIKVHIACGVTDMRKGIDGLATLVQEVLLHDPFAGHLFAFRGGKANLIKILYWDGTGLCLFTNRLEHRIFEWPTVGGAGETVSLTDVSGLDAYEALLRFREIYLEEQEFFVFKFGASSVTDICARLVQDRSNSATMGAWGEPGSCRTRVKLTSSSAKVSLCASIPRK